MIRYLANAFIALIAMLPIAAQEQTHTIKGKVTDNGGVAIAGAVAKLKMAGLIDTTGADGAFELKAKATSVQAGYRAVPNIFSATLRNNSLKVDISKESDLVVTVYSLQGRVRSSTRYRLRTGTHYLDFNSLRSGFSAFLEYARRSPKNGQASRIQR